MTYTYKDALNWLNEIRVAYHDLESFCAKFLCEDAVNKQIKKQPVLIDGRMRCPECESNCNSLNHYCDNCGQAIDWDEE